MSRPQSPKPPTPEKLGRYDIEGELGKGAMGVVYLAKDPIIGRKLAIKTFNLAYPAREKDAEVFRKRFLREAQSAGILTHPNIVTIHDVMEDPSNGGYCIAMEYVKGIDLKQQMQREGKLPLEFAIDLAAQIGDGLSYAHSKGVVHRDVKPANIILTADKQAKITDFGIARMEESNLTRKGQLLGTPNYMSPEQIQGQPVDHRADLFSLGVMLYELVTRKKPFQGENLNAVTHRIVYDSFTPLVEIIPGVPPRLDEILDRALAKKADDRYQDGADFAADLRGVLRVLSGEEAEVATSLPAASLDPVMLPPPDLPSPPAPPAASQPAAPQATVPQPVLPPQVNKIPPLPPLGPPSQAQAPPPKPAPPKPAPPKPAPPKPAPPKPAPPKPAPPKPAPPKPASKLPIPPAAIAAMIGLAIVGVMAFFAWSKDDPNTAVSPDIAVQKIISPLNDKALIDSRRDEMNALFSTLDEQILAVEEAVAAEQAALEGEEGTETSVNPSDLADLARGTYKRLTAIAYETGSPLRFKKDIQRQMLEASQSLALLDGLLGEQDLESVWLNDRLNAVAELLSEDSYEDAEVVLVRVLDLYPDNEDALDLQSALQRRQKPRPRTPQPTVRETPPSTVAAAPPPATVAPKKALLRIELNTMWSEGQVDIKLDDRLIHSQDLAEIPGKTKKIRRREFRDQQQTIAEVEVEAGTYALRVFASMPQSNNLIEREGGAASYVIEGDQTKTLKIFVTADPSLRIVP